MQKQFYMENLAWMALVITMRYEEFSLLRKSRPSRFVTNSPLSNRLQFLRSLALIHGRICPVQQILQCFMPPLIGRHMSHAKT